MEQNNIITAPSVADVQELFELWQESHSGGMADFYRFMCSPSEEREAFLARCHQEVSMLGDIAVIEYSPL